jgi:hypothetical protein
MSRSIVILSKAKDLCSEGEASLAQSIFTSKFDHVILSAAKDLRSEASPCP